MKDIKSLYQTAKNSHNKADIAAYTEAIQSLLESKPTEFLSNLKYIISSDIGLPMLEKFEEKYGLSIAAYGPIIEAIDDCITKCEEKKIDATSYKECKAHYESFYDQYRQCFNMFQYYAEESFDTQKYLETYYGFNPNGVQNNKLLVGMINNFGESAIADALITADKIGSSAVGQVLSYVESKSESRFVDQWVYEASSNINTEDKKSISAIDSIKSRMLESCVNEIKSKTQTYVREALLIGNDDPILEYTSDDLKNIIDLIHFKEYQMICMESSDDAINLQKQIYSLYEEVNHIYDENGNPILEDIADSIVPMLPSSTNTGTISKPGTNVGGNKLNPINEDLSWANTRNKKTGQIPRYLGANHNLTYGEDDGPTQSNNNNNDDNGSEPSLDDFKRPSAIAKDDDTNEPDSALDKDPTVAAGMTPDEKRVMNNYYYYTYNNSLNRNSHSFNKHDDHSVDNSVDNTKKSDDHSVGKHVNSHNDNTDDHSEDKGDNRGNTTQTESCIPFSKLNQVNKKRLAAKIKKVGLDDIIKDKIENGNTAVIKVDDLDDFDKPINESSENDKSFKDLIGKKVSMSIKDLEDLDKDVFNKLSKDGKKPIEPIKIMIVDESTYTEGFLDKFKKKHQADSSPSAPNQSVPAYTVDTSKIIKLTPEVKTNISQRVFAIRDQLIAKLSSIFEQYKNFGMHLDVNLDNEDVNTEEELSKELDATAYSSEVFLMHHKISVTCPVLYLDNNVTFAFQVNGAEWRDIWREIIDNNTYPEEKIKWKDAIEHNDKIGLSEIFWTKPMFGYDKSVTQICDMITSIIKADFPILSEWDYYADGDGIAYGAEVDITKIYPEILSTRGDDTSFFQQTPQQANNLIPAIQFGEAVDDANDHKPESDHPIRDTLAEVDKKSAEVNQKIKKGVQGAGNVVKTAVKPVVRTKQWVTNMISDWKDADENKVKEKLADPKARKNIFSAIGWCIKTGSILKAGLLFNPIFLFLSITRGVTKDKREYRIRNEMIGELKTEIEVIDEKIKDADRNGDNKAKYQLMRLRNEVNKKLLRVSGSEGNKKWSKRGEVI